MFAGVNLEKLSREGQSCQLKSLGGITSLVPTSHTVFTACTVTFCTTKRYCSECPQNKGRANPCVIVLYTQAIQRWGGLASGKL